MDNAQIMHTKPDRQPHPFSSTDCGYGYLAYTSADDRAASQNLLEVKPGRAEGDETREKERGGGGGERERERENSNVRQASIIGYVCYTLPTISCNKCNLKMKEIILSQSTGHGIGVLISD